MCWNRTCNENVMGNSNCRRNCCCYCRCFCRCYWGRDNVAGDANRIALRGPGCISGTGQCDRYTNNFVMGNSGFDSFCGQVSPSGNTQLACNRRRCGNNVYSDQFEDYFENSNGCPR